MDIMFLLKAVLVFLLKISTSFATIGLRCDMIPEGVIAPKFTKPTNIYKIDISGNPDSYVPEEQYTVFLHASAKLKEQRKFTHFIISVTNENHEKNIASETSVGTLQLYGDTLTKFSDRCQNAVVESDSQLKAEIQFLWLAPAKNSGCIKFKATVVESVSSWFSENDELTKILCEEASDTEDTQPKILKNCCTCDEAKYEVTFEGLWTRNTHPKDFPDNGKVTKFSDIIGASHTVNYTFWNYGELASEGLQELAEYGNTRLLETELKAKSDHIRTIIKARGITYPNITGKTFAVFRVDSKHHLMSIVSKVDPSPDWIVGVSGLELCLRNCSWIMSKTINLYPWDVGTNDGITYLSYNQHSFNKQPIRRLKSDYPDDPRSPFYDPVGLPMKPFARLSLSRQRLYEKSCDSPISGDSDIHFICETTEWSDWSPCSVTCGKGVRYKQRKYKYEEGKYICQKKLTERATCEADQKYCPRIYEREWENNLCKMGPWSSWSSCSVTCGKGTKTRDRKFKTRYAAKRCVIGRARQLVLQQNLECWGSKKCDDFEEEECPQMTWSDWSPCSTTCGKGFKERYRLALQYNEKLILEWSGKLKDNGNADAEDPCEKKNREWVECFVKPCQNTEKQKHAHQ